MDEYDVRVVGERKSRTIDEPIESVAVASTRGSVDVTDASDGLVVAVEGDRNSVVVGGSDGTVRLRIDGQRNSITVADTLELVVERDDGSANSIARQSFETDEDGAAAELIRQDREEAYASLGWFGYSLVSYQTKATEQEFCQNCGRETDAVVRRHSERVLTVLGLSVSVGESTTADECEYCTLQVPDADVALSDAERRDIYG
ncbi:hypothetical protein OB920_02700 [Halobacteria archaeon HArc-gm2]|nr:hypothetical protein [Halobacteria archaeon HArc-gm2]